MSNQSRWIFWTDFMVQVLYKTYLFWEVQNLAGLVAWATILNKNEQSE